MGGTSLGALPLLILVLKKIDVGSHTLLQFTGATVEACYMIHNT